jgi:hypothetical protein
MVVGTHAVDLHDGLAVDRERVVRHAGGQMDEAGRRQPLGRSAIELLAGADGELAGDHGDELVLGVAVRRHDVAGGKFQPDHERPGLRRAAEQRGRLGAGRQGRRRRSPLHGVGRHHGVMQVRGPGGRAAVQDDSRGERYGEKAGDAGQVRDALHAKLHSRRELTRRLTRPNHQELTFALTSSETRRAASRRVGNKAGAADQPFRRSCA